MGVRTEARGPVLLVTLDRPEVHNAIDPETHAELLAAWVRLRDEEDLRVGVLTGAGEKAFCAGVDLRRMGDFYQAVPPERRREVFDREPGIGGITRNFDVGKPILAAIHGYCLGGGLELALACDLRYAAPTASFALPEVKWAILPGQGGTQRLPRAIPLGIALEMILSSRPIGAQRAYEVGLLNGIFPTEALLPGVLRLAEHLAAQPPRALRHAREAVLRGLELPLPEGIRLEQSLAEPLRDSAENKVARARFAAGPPAGDRPS
jgi:enoyl-CoA hydratase/carnithine racemase